MKRRISLSDSVPTNLPFELPGGLDARFCEVMDVAPVMIWVSNTDKQCVWFNLPWLNFRGRDIQQELGTGWSEGVHPKDLDPCLQTYISHFDARKEFRMEYRLRRYDGAYRWIDDTGIPRYARDGSFLGYIGSCIDIHVHRETQRELRRRLLEVDQLRQRAEAAELKNIKRTSELAQMNRFNVAGQLAATIAHELNQPLAAILTNSESGKVLLDSSAPNLEELKTILTEIKRDNQRASDVLNRVRELLAKAPFQRKKNDLNGIVRDTVELLSRLATSREVDLGSETLSEELPVECDRTQLQQVIINLALNAMDATSGMPRVNRKIVVTTMRVENCAEIAVSDDGPGVDNVQLVFQPFFTTKSHGMGMGLSIARAIVEAHDGQIWAENKTAGGAEFHVRVPLSGR
ncbi:ATP-binding protein [Bradyrhizobium sp. PMVTL-01]|uniref:ATP-binding protein n=1 Tax=Bradyrhizobium sp. PMVTL-01 TaxID=3434999 RepID=UPI003F6F3C58